jgi:hypothetical protein
MAERSKDPFVRNQRFTFGLLNTAQDGADLESQDAQICQGLDADYLALGTLRSSAYIGMGTGAQDLTTTSVLDSDFRVNAGNIEYDSGSGWVNIDDYLTAPNKPNTVLTDNGAFVDLIEDNYIGFTATDVIIQDTPSATKATISGKDYATPNQSYSVKARLTDGKTNFQRFINTTNSWDDKHPCDGTFANFLNGLYVSVPAALASTLNDGDQFVFNVSEDLLDDGTYFYSVSMVTEINSLEIESLYSEVSNITLKNEDSLGALVATNKPGVTVTMDPNNRQWVYRKGPNEDEWVRIKIVEPGTGDYTFTDNIQISSLIDTKIISVLNPDDLDGLLDASGATSWAYIFEKDNRLWAVPADRKDLVFFSNPLEWWRWTRTNSIGFDGDFTGMTELRDTMSVELKNTAVFQTTSGLYNVYGDGTEDSPYLRVAHETDFSSTSNGSVKANNLIYMITDGSTYEDGPWGRKLYSYNMKDLIELSGRVRNTPPFVSDTVGVSYINQIGGDKLLIVLDNGTNLVYHIKLGGFLETTSALETAGDWNWKSGIYHPLYSFATKMGNVDKYALVWNGDIDITWSIDGVETTVNHTATQRSYLEFQLPGNWGKEMTFEINGMGGAILYDMYFIGDR